LRRRGVVLAALAVACLVVAAGGAAAEARHAPRIQVEPEAFDFGRALPGKVLRKEFTLRNSGDRDLVLAGVSTTCGCTAALPDERTIAPGRTTPLRVTLETRNYSGHVERRVLVRSNDPETPALEIKLSVTVEAPAK
jgi:hypothetical protein